MPVRFRRTFKIFPGVKVNVSKGGISFTVGAKGYHLNFSDRGVKQTVGIPGTGVSHSTYLTRHDNATDVETKEETGSKIDDDLKTKAEPREEAVEAQVTSRRRTPGWILLVGLVVVYLGALVLGLIPTNFLSQVLRTLLEWTRSAGL